MANKAKVKETLFFQESKNESRYAELPIKMDNKELLQNYTREAVSLVFKKKGGIGVPRQNLIHLIVTRYKINIVELIEYAKITLNEMPDISNKNLRIILLLKVANNSKNRKIGKIAKFMLKENWWAKSGEKKMGDFYNRFIAYITKQKTIDLIKEILFMMLEMIIDKYRRPSDDKNQK